MGYQARRHHRIEVLTNNAKTLALQRLDDRLAQLPPRPADLDELRAIVAEAADQFIASADGDMPFSADDVKVITETLLLVVLAARLFVLDSVAMITRVSSRLAALADLVEQAPRVEMNEPTTQPAAPGPAPDPPS